MTSIKSNVHRRLDGPCNNLYLHPALTEAGYSCYLLLASVFPVPEPTETHPFLSLNCEHGTNEKSLFFFPLPGFLKWKWRQVVTQSFSQSFVWGVVRVDFKFVLILCVDDWYFFIRGLAMRGKNLKDRCWLFVASLFFFPSSILNLSFLCSSFLQDVFCVFLCHCGCFCSLVDVRGGRDTAARPVKGHRSPHFLVVWRDPSFASKWKSCLTFSEEIHFIGAVGYNYCITTQL